MANERYYRGEADKAKQIYLKEDHLVSRVGEFHDSVEFVFVREGVVEAHLYGDTKVMTEGCIFFADSYECHYYKPLTQKIKVIVLVLSREYIKDFRELYSGMTFNTFMFDKEKNKRIIEIVRKWMEEPLKTHIKNLGYANLLFSYLSESYPLVKVRERDNDSFIKDLLKYIHKHYLEDITLNSIAKMCGYSADYCSKILKKYVGCNFREYLNMLRMRKAEELLADKSLKMTTLEILYKCGFNSPATFYRARKRNNSQ